MLTTSCELTLMVSSLPELVWPGEWFRRFLRAEFLPLLCMDLWEEEKEGWGEGTGLWPIERLPGLPPALPSMPGELVPWATVSHTAPSSSMLQGEQEINSPV